MGVVRGVAAALAGAVATALLTTVAPGSAGAPAPDRPTDTARATKVVAAPAAPETRREVRETRRYWTPERMRAALPIEDVLPGLLLPATETTGARADRGTTSSERPVRWKRAPRTTGKLFFRDGASDFVCSASAIRTKRRNQVITAGHCVHSGPNVGLLQQPRFFSDWVFVPRYRDGKAPYGRWVGRNAFAFNGWIEHEAFRYDQAIITFKRHRGRRLVDAVGGNEVVWGNDQRQWGTTIWGWPAEAPYDGEVARTCTGRTTRFEDGADAARHRCDLYGGASGGPWFLPKGRTQHSGRIWAITSRRVLETPVLLARPLPRQIRQMIRTANR
jgi:V8-like Glu-specific endopeptidase